MYTNDYIHLITSIINIYYIIRTTYIYVYLHTYLHTYLYAHLHTHMHICIFTLAWPVRYRNWLHTYCAHSISMFLYNIPVILLFSSLFIRYPYLHTIHIYLHMHIYIYLITYIFTHTYRYGNWLHT